MRIYKNTNKTSQLETNMKDKLKDLKEKVNTEKLKEMKGKVDVDKLKQVNAEGVKAFVTQNIKAVGAAVAVFVVIVIGALSFGSSNQLTEEDFATCQKQLSVEMEKTGFGQYKNTRLMNDCLAKKAISLIGDDKKEVSAFKQSARQCSKLQYSSPITAQNYIDRYTHGMKEAEMIKKAGGDDKAIAAIKKFYETENVQWAGRKDYEMSAIHSDIIRKEFMQCLNKSLE